MASADKSSGSQGADKGGPPGSDSDDQPDEVDEWGEESFPASDPPASWSGPPDT